MYPTNVQTTFISRFSWNPLDEENSFILLIMDEKEIRNVICPVFTTEAPAP